MSNEKTICSLDIGSNKICCCVASVNISQKDPKIKVLSYYPIYSKAFKNGFIDNINDLTNDIGSAVQSVENMIDAKIDKLIVGFPGIACQSGYTKAKVNLEGDTITEQYIHKLISKSFHRTINEKEDIIHFLPINYSINGKDGIKNPIDQHADSFSIDLHYVKTNRSFKKTLDKAITKNRLNVNSFCNSAYASGLACLTEDEKEIGTTVIDIGQESCDIAMFKNGVFMYAFSILNGGFKVTKNIKNKLKCSIATAERLKIIKGELTSNNKNNSIEYREEGTINENTFQQISTESFVNIIQDSINNILYECYEQIKENPFYKASSNNIVLTGGVSSTPNILSKAEEIFETPIRLGMPLNCQGIPSSYNNPTSSCNIGLIRYAINTMTEKDMVSNKHKDKKLKRLTDWILESF